MQLRQFVIQPSIACRWASLSGLRTMTGAGMVAEAPADPGSAVDVADPDSTCDVAVGGTPDCAPHAAASAINSSAPMIFRVGVVFIDR